MSKKCEQCGTPALDDQSEFCNRCGSLVKEEPKIKLPVCTRCKNPAPNADVLFCNRCGTQYPAAEPENNCPRCGNIIHDEQSEFCNRCGAPVRPEPESTVPVCSRCGNPAPDDHALFCNRCGTEYKKEPEINNLLCPGCGYLMIDDQSQFCNRCGTAIAQEPVNKKPACPNCGVTAPDKDTLFCNRCGTQFNRPLSNKKPVHSPAHKPGAQVSVRISKRKQPPALIAVEDLLDPVPDEEFAEENFPPPVASPAQKKYAHLPLTAEEPGGRRGRDESIVIPGNSKKYAHLPLVADEFKEKQSPRLEIESPYFPAPPKEKKAAKPKKGFFDLLKK